MDALVQQGSTVVLPDGLATRPHMGKFGQLFTGSWLQAMALRGQVFYAKVGAFSTPIVGGGAGTIIDLDQPEFGMSVPAGKAVIPLLVEVQAQTPLLATDADESEILLAADTAAAAVLDGTWANTIIPSNWRTNSGNNSGCTVKSVCSGDTTDPTLDLEIARSVIIGDVQGSPANAMWTKHELKYQPELPPIIVGPAGLFLYWGGTVATYAFAQVVWGEINTTDL